MVPVTACCQALQENPNLAGTLPQCLRDSAGTLQKLELDHTAITGEINAVMWRCQRAGVGGLQGAPACRSVFGMSEKAGPKVAW